MSIVGQHVLIVGGGITGILLALKLSKQNPGEAEIILVESGASLGGRGFFSATKQGASGFGFELFPTEAVQILERHIRSQLTEDEQKKLDDCYTSKEPTIELQFVRKSPVMLSKLISQPTDLLTRYGAEHLHTLIKKAEAQAKLGLELNASNEKFSDSELWKPLGKDRKEELTSVLETLVGPDFLQLPPALFLRLLNAAVKDDQQTLPAFALRSSTVESAILEILQARGVNVLLEHRVMRVHRESESVMVSVATPQHNLRQFTCDKVCVAVPLANTISFLQREDLGGAQGKQLAKIRPQSIVALELFQWRQQLDASMELPQHDTVSSRLCFPVERVRGLVTGQGSLLLYAVLDFEISMQAGQVREAVARMRRAAQRLFQKESEARLTAKTGENERIVLLPVGVAIPNGSLLRNDLKEVRTQIPGVYLCGEGFAYGTEPWKSIVESIQQVNQECNK